MRTRLRLGAASAIGLGALLLATVLASPALAWHSDVKVTADCLDGKILVHYTVSAWEDRKADVEVSYELNGVTKSLPSGAFEPDDYQFSGEFDLPLDTTGTVTVTAVADWRHSEEESTNEGSVELPPADEECEEDQEVPPSTDETPTTEGDEVTPTTEDEVVLGESSTTEATGLLPFTGASSVPMLLAGIGLLGGGFLIVWSSRTKGRHAAR